MNPLYTYRFTKADHDALQNYFLDQDVFGSSWKGEEVIEMYQDRIRHFRNGDLLKEYPSHEYSGFFIDQRVGTWRLVILIKKPEYKSAFEQYIVPLGYGGRSIAGLSEKAKFTILGSKIGEFVQGLSQILPEITQGQQSALRGNVIYKATTVQLAIAGIIMVVCIIMALIVIA